MKRDVKDVHIYFPSKVMAAIKKVAKENRRSVSAEVIIATERYIDYFHNHKMQQAAEILESMNRDTQRSANGAKGKQ